jgi:phosphate transport system permease protein
MAHGEPWVWLMSGSLAVAVTMIVGLLLFITVRGSLHFWPRPLYEITLRDGETCLGEVTSRETVSNNPQEDETFDDRRLVHIANFELTGTHYRWINESDIATTQQPKFATVVERLEGGRFHGFPVRVLKNGVAVSIGPETAWLKYKEIAPAIRQQFRDANHLDKHERGELQQRLRSARLAMFNARLKYGTEENSFVDAARDKEKQISKEVATLSSRLDKKLASLRKVSQAWSFEFETAEGSFRHSSQ